MNLEGLKKVKYHYYDKDGNVHKLETLGFEIIDVDKLKKGKELKTNKFRDETAVKTIIYDKNGVDAKEARIYTNGDVITKGTFRIKYRIYKKDEGKVFLTKMKELNVLTY